MKAHIKGIVTLTPIVLTPIDLGIQSLFAIRL